MRFWLSGLALVLALVGCSAPGEFVGPDRPTMAVPAPTETAADDVAAIVVGLDDEVVPSPSPSPSMVRGLDGQPKPIADRRTIEADPALAAEMGCEPLPQVMKDEIHRLWGEPVNEGYMIEVGEGLEEGETWWLLTMRTTSKEFGERRSDWLTNAPGVLPAEQGQWFVLDDDLNFGVKWDAERFIRARSAQMKALDCLS